MTDFIVVGSDTDVGKTTFSLLWLAAFPNDREYWKPVETGDSDTERVRTTFPNITVHTPYARFKQPVSPPRAAYLEGKDCPSADVLVKAKPSTHKDRFLLIETFGSPFSPLNDTQLQIEFIRRLNLPTILIVSSAIGAIGRTIQSLYSLETFGASPSLVVLMGKKDDYAVAEIVKHRPGAKVFCIDVPTTQDERGLRELVDRQRAVFDEIDLELTSIAATAFPTARLIEEDSQLVWHPYEPLRGRADPLPVVGAEDEFLQLADGRRVIDGFSSWWTILHGHRHPPLMTALRSAAGRIDHIPFAGFTHPDAVRLAALLLLTTPWQGGRVFYSDNGSTAVEVALKMAYQFWCHQGEPHRTMFVSFENGYHGDTFGAMAVGRDPLFFGKFEPLLFKTAQTPQTHPTQDELLREKGKQTAAVILEPLVQGAGGMVMHSPERLQELFAVAKKHGLLFIADEVMTGNRTGRRWAYQHAGIAPDLICAAKTLTGGILPFAATLASPKITAAFDTDDRSKTFFHGHSFTGHPLACAVAARNEELVADPAVHARAREIGQFFAERLRDLNDVAGVREVRVRASIAAVELESNDGYLAPIGERVKRRALELGVLLRPLGNVVYAIPPLGISQESLERVAEAMREGIKSAIGKA